MVSSNDGHSNKSNCLISVDDHGYNNNQFFIKNHDDSFKEINENNEVKVIKFPETKNKTRQIKNYKKCLRVVCNEIKNVPITKDSHLKNNVEIGKSTRSYNLRNKNTTINYLKLVNNK